MNSMKGQSGTVAVVVVLIVLSFFFGRATVKPKIEVETVVKTVETIVYKPPEGIEELCSNLHKQEIRKSDAYYEGYKAGLNAR